MNESILARTIADLSRPLAASLGCDVWGVEAVQGKRAIIRVYVEGRSGVDIDTCAELSRLLGLALDVEDLIPGAYVLEVSSPGLERTFFTPEQLAARAGEVVEVTLHAPTNAYPGRKKLIGILGGVSGGIFSVAPLDLPKEAPALFAWDNVKKANRVHFLPETPEAAKGGKPKKPKPPREKEAGGGGNEDEAAS
jgi:ribosome maturation factor RimP